MVIRANVENDENADCMTDEKFWPRGITCRPWLSYGMYRDRIGKNDTDDSDTYNQKQRKYNTDDRYKRRFFRSNRYEGLDIDIDN